MLVIAGALFVGSCASTADPGAVSSSIEPVVSTESFGGVSVEAYVSALAEVCGSACLSSAVSVLVQLVGDAQLAKEAIAELSDGIDFLPSGADLRQLLEDGRQPPIYVVGTARPAGGEFVIVPVETILEVDGTVDYRADDIVLRLEGERWTVIADPSKVGVTVTTSVS